MDLSESVIVDRRESAEAAGVNLSESVSLTDSITESVSCGSIRFCIVNRRSL